MEVKKKVPAIRFSSFDGEWILSEFSKNIKSIQTGTNTLGSYIYSGMPLIKMGNLQRGYFSLERTEFLPKDQIVDSCYVLNYGDFLVNTRNTLELVGKGATWLKDSGEFVFNNNIARFIFSGVDTIFFNYQYNTQNLISQVQARAMGTTSVAAIYPRSLNSITYYLPSLPEQARIGNFLKTQDEKIALQEQKHEKLVQLKKAMLVKLFPKLGAKVPEIRFKGFAGDWEETKLGDVVTLNPKASLPDVFEYVDLESVVGTELVSHRTEYRITAPSRAQRVARVGDIFYQTVRPYQKNNTIFQYKRTDFVFSTGYAQLRSKINNLYLFVILQTDLFVNEVMSNCTGTSYPAINSSDLANIVLKVPTELEEQQKIGEFFEKLDKLMAESTVLIDKYKNIKQALLSKMFV